MWASKCVARFVIESGFMLGDLRERFGGLESAMVGTIRKLKLSYTMNQFFASWLQEEQSGDEV